MTDETKNKRPKLPPGWGWRELLGDVYLFGPAVVQSDPKDLPGTADRCWAYWAGVSGITREKWEQMERDHKAMGALRERSEARVRAVLMTQGDGVWTCCLDHPLADDDAEAEHFDPESAVIVAGFKLGRESR